MSADLIPFTSDEFALELIPHGDSFKVAAPGLARALGFRDAPAMTRSVPEDEKGYTNLCTPGGEQAINFVTESGFYRVIGQRQASRVKDDEMRARVERFQSWFYGDVLPSIRKHGGYLTATKVEEVLSNPDTIIRLATDLKAERARRAELEALREIDAPKVLFADAVSASKSNILVGELAKILKGNGIDIGANRLFELLRSKGYLISRKGTDWNMPTQKSMELGLFRIKETTVVHSDGHTSLNKTPKVTGKGQQYFIERFLDGRLEAVA